MLRHRFGRILQANRSYALKLRTPRAQLIIKRFASESDGDALLARVREGQPLSELEATVLAARYVPITIQNCFKCLEFI